MRWLKQGVTLLMLLVLAGTSPTADPPAKRSPRDALKPFNELIGSWRAIGTPEGSLQVKQKGLWQETMRWVWEFKGNDAWLNVSFNKGKHFVDGELRYVPDKDHFQLTLNTTDKETLTFTGPLKDHLLILEREDPKTKDAQKLVISLLHDNRYLYHYEVKPQGKPLFAKQYLVGCTKEGVPFAISSGEVGPLCVVSGGPPTSPVTYKGKTYYVCCSGCRDAFKAEPEKYIKEYEELMAKMAKERAEKYKKP
jgi:hypothetical protein